MAVVRKMRRDWERLRQGKPGSRFVERYERAAGSASAWGRVANWSLALVAAALAIFLTMFPGPALPFWFLAGALLAAQSRRMARCLDWLELRWRAVWQRVRPHWRRLPPIARRVLVTLTIAGSVASAYASYCWLSD